MDAQADLGLPVQPRLTWDARCSPGRLTFIVSVFSVQCWRDRQVGAAVPGTGGLLY